MYQIEHRKSNLELTRQSESEYNRNVYNRPNRLVNFSTTFNLSLNLCSRFDHPLHRRRKNVNSYAFEQLSGRLMCHLANYGLNAKLYTNLSKFISDFVALCTSLFISLFIRLSIYAPSIERCLFKQSSNPPKRKYEPIANPSTNIKLTSNNDECLSSPKCGEYCLNSRMQTEPPIVIPLSTSGEKPDSNLIKFLCKSSAPIKCVQHRHTSSLLRVGLLFAFFGTMAAVPRVVKIGKFSTKKYFLFFCIKKQPHNLH